MTIDWEPGVVDPARLAALERSGLVGTGPEDVFDRLIELASELTGVRRGAITLVDAKFTTAKSSIGFPEGLPIFAPIEHAFCRFVVGSGRPLVVDDANRDPRTIGDPAIEAYTAIAWAGFAIEDTEGNVLGTFCLMDSHPHEWTAGDLHVLATLAKAASSEIALRRSQIELESARGEAEALRMASRRRSAALASQVNVLVAAGDLSESIGQLLLDSYDLQEVP